MTDEQEIPVEDLPVDVQSVAPEPAANLAQARKTDAQPGWMDAGCRGPARLVR